MNTNEESVITVSVNLIQKIRVRINKVERKHLLINKLNQWLQLTSALNALEDSSCAIEYYLKSKYPDEISGKYLFTYGLIQALYLQQDSANSIYRSLHNRKIDFREQYPKAFAVREMRDDQSHPTCRNGGFYIYLKQISLKKDGFSYRKVPKSFEEIYVDVFSAINDNAGCINAILTEVIDDMDAEFRKYIMAHRGIKMVEIFQELAYAKQKISDDDPLEAAGYESTKQMVDSCRQELCSRYGSWEAVSSYKYLLIDIDKVYNLIDVGLPRIPCDIRGDIKHCLYENLVYKLEQLKKLAEDTDREFEEHVD